MTEPVRLLVSCSAGLLAGSVFFGGLWWTVVRVATARSPKLLLLESFLVRAAVALLVLYFSAGEDMVGFGGYLLGFLAARTAVMRRLRRSPQGGEGSR